MRIGIPREVKPGERRVGLTPLEVARLAQDGHTVIVERGAGDGVGHPDDAYGRAGATIAPRDAVWAAELVVKVKEIQPVDAPAPGGTLFGFQHLVGDPVTTRRLAHLGASAIAYEMVRDGAGGFPLLAPMSRIAGRMAIQVGRDILGRVPAKVLVLGAGHAGLAAASAAAALGAEVVVLSRSTRGIAQPATAAALDRHAADAELIVGAVFVPGAATPKLLPRERVRRMPRGAVIVDVSIDAGGVAETSRPTTHADPTYVEEGVVHYCVGNMPAAEPERSAAALAAAALPFVRELAAKGIAGAVRDNAALRAGVLLWKGRVNHEGIAAGAGLPYTPLVDSDLP
jgi:alanine dehydrogenase